MMVEFVYQAPVSPKCFTSRTTLVTVVTCWVVCCLCVRATSAAAAAATAAEFGAVESDGTSLCTDKCEEFGECSVAWPLLKNCMEEEEDGLFLDGIDSLKFDH